MKTYQQLTLRQRYQIQACYEAQYSYKAIGEKVGCHKATVSREIRRCAPGHYCAFKANRDAVNKRKNAPKFTKYTDELKAIIEALLENGLSPGATAGRCQLEKVGMVSHETIYQWIYRDKQRGGQLHKYLLRAFRGHRKKRGTPDGRGLLADRTSIDERGKAANDRLHRGHWEGDTVHGKKGNLVTLVDRKSRFLIARKSQTRTKIEVTDQLKKMLKKQVARTLTVDNGREFYGHRDVAKQAQVKVYFADPYASWQRGSNENVNGLLRRYYPKGFDFTTINAQQLRRTVEKINLLPRKILGWKSAHEVHYGVSVALIA